MSTTPTAVREAVAALVEALAPTTLPADPFSRYEGTLRYEEYVAANPAHCFRWFELRFDPFASAPAVVSGSALYRYPFRLAMAYPRAHFKTLDLPALDIDQAIAEDQDQIHAKVRDYTGAAFVADSLSVQAEADEDSDTVMVRWAWDYEMWRTV